MLTALMPVAALPTEAKPAWARSPHWPAARAAHLVAEPACAACGGTTHLEVHHVLPFHAFPSLELDPANHVTLCEAPGRNCHYVHGHACHWKGWVPTVREDAAAFRRRFEASAKLATAPAAVAPPIEAPTGPEPGPQPESNR